jgi:hypothetical protein
MLAMNPKMLPRLDEIEEDLLAAEPAPNTRHGSVRLKASTSPSPSSGRNERRPSDWPASRRSSSVYPSSQRRDDLSSRRVVCPAPASSWERPGRTRPASTRFAA